MNDYTAWDEYLRTHPQGHPWADWIVLGVIAMIVAFALYGLYTDFRGGK